jgi:hypothetical protein
VAIMSIPGVCACLGLYGGMVEDHVFIIALAAW